MTTREEHRKYAEYWIDESDKVYDSWRFGYKDRPDEVQQFRINYYLQMALIEATLAQTAQSEVKPVQYEVRNGLGEKIG